MMSFRQGLTRLEISVIVVVALALFAPLQTAKGTGSKQLLIHFTGTSAPDVQIQVATIQEKDVAILLTDSSHSEIRWRWQEVPQDESSIECKLIFGFNSTGGLLFSYGRQVFPYADAIAVKYSVAGESPRYRVIPFAWPTKSTMELTISREPPNADEAWKPR